MAHPDDHDRPLPSPHDEASSIERPAGEPPVVARLIVEIRSDGSTTVARGAVDDLENGVRVSLEARGTTPASLAASLVAAMLEVPVMAGLGRLAPRLVRTASRALLPGRGRKAR